MGKLIERSGFWVRDDNVEQDLVIVNDIWQQDAYKVGLLHPRQRQGEVVVDVGAHIGCFARLWHERDPSARILCVEACPENLEALRANVGKFADVVHAACTYEPGAVGLLNTIRPECENTGGSTVVPLDEIETAIGRPSDFFWRDRRPLSKVTLEDLMARLGVDFIDILKLDCEGSEYSILGQTPSLNRIGFVLGEYHDRGKWDRFRASRLADWDYGHMLDAGEFGGNFHYRNPAWIWEGAKRWA